MLEYQEQVLMDCREERSSIVTGQMNLFGGESEAVRETPIPSLPELERSALLQLEHEVWGCISPVTRWNSPSGCGSFAVPRRRLHCQNSRTAGSTADRYATACQAAHHQKRGNHVFSHL